MNRQRAVGTLMVLVSVWAGFQALVWAVYSDAYVLAIVAGLAALVLGVGGVAVELRATEPLVHQEGAT